MPSEAPATLALPAPPPQKLPSTTTSAPPSDSAAPVVGEDSESEIGAAFEKRWPTKQTEAPPEKEEAAATPPAKEVAKPVDKAAPGKDDRTLLSNKQFRAQLDKVTAEATTAKTTIAQLEAKIKDAEEKGKDATVYSERLKVIEKERDDLHSELRALKQEASPEFKAKWDKPFEQAATYAKREVEQLLVTNAEDGTNRAATWDDFSVLYHMPKGKAILAAKEMFGDASSIVVQHLTELQRLDWQRGEALKEEKATWATKQQEQEAKAAQQKEQFGTLKVQAFRELEEAHPEWFKDDPEDTEANELLKAERQSISVQPKTAKEAVDLQAKIFHRAAAWPRAMRTIDKLKEENQSLKTTIDQMKNSDPSRRTARQGEAVSSTKKPWAEDLRQSVTD